MPDPAVETSSADAQGERRFLRALRQLSARPDPAEGLSGLLRAAAEVFLRQVDGASFEVYVLEGPRVQAWRFTLAPDLQGREHPAPELRGHGPACERVARALEPGALDRFARTPSGSLWAGAQALLACEVEEGAEAVLRLVKARGTFDALEVERCEALACALGGRLASLRALLALRERVKELDCVYRIARIARGNGETEALLAEIVELLPSAWQHPEATSARITLGEQRFDSAGFRGGADVLRAPIGCDGGEAGQVEIFLAGHEQEEGDPFLPEERPLIAAVARELSSLLERLQAERKRARLQEQLLHADRLATIGQLAAGVAHELNEPLASVLGFAQLATKAPELSDATRRDVERIAAAALHARDVIRNLLVFSRQTPAQKQRVAPREVLERALALVEPRCLEAGVRVERGGEDPLPAIEADPAQLQQVFLNLLVNAIQAMPRGGALRVSMEAEDRQLIVRFQDSGAGIAPEDLDRVFLPFFTTKDVGEGTGLGLSVVHGIVSAHGGTVEVTSRPGRGTCFEVRLPLPSALDARQDTP